MSTAMTLETKNIVHAKQTLCMVMCCVLIMSVFLLGTASVSLCTGAASDAASAIQTGINQMATEIYKLMRGIITPLTICGFAWAGFSFLLGGSQGTEKARKILIGSAVGLALVAFAPVFGQAVATWFSGTSSGDLSTFNPL